ncbi:hypothetical protein LSH36_454g02012 [Paralvinella palmiformis]|uniref:Uncharacterized protein n=1 Tax=Paralvinella palmiformis TaxID=53620 RepID=A0AAD9JA94_9ANNE|nr:hypothetical protein LSH36_454g02012 [Paralvinella palmiformis]
MRMGASLSRKKRDDKSVWSGPPGDHSPFPLDPVPYPGSDILYCFVDITVSYKFMRNDVNLGPQVVTTDIDEHVDDILDCYEDGFSLNEFVKIPFVKCTTEIQDWSEEYPYHAVLSKPTVRHIWDGLGRWHCFLSIYNRIVPKANVAAIFFSENSSARSFLHE